MMQHKMLMCAAMKNYCTTMASNWQMALLTITIMLESKFVAGVLSKRTAVAIKGDKA
jgi:hypothetical protein